MMLKALKFDAMKTIKVILLFACAQLFISKAYGGDGGGKILHIMAHTQDVIIFEVETHNNPPACSGNQWALSLTTETGRAQYALLLSAASQGKSVTVSGTGDCSAWSDREAPQYIYVNY